MISFFVLFIVVRLFVACLYLHININEPFYHLYIILDAIRDTEPSRTGLCGERGITEQCSIENDVGLLCDGVQASWTL